MDNSINFDYYMCEAERDDSDDRRIHDENIDVGTSPETLGDINNVCTCSFCGDVKFVLNPFTTHVFWMIMSLNSD